MMVLEIYFTVSAIIIPSILIFELFISINLGLSDSNSLEIIKFCENGKHDIIADLLEHLDRTPEGKVNVKDFTHSKQISLFDPAKIRKIVQDEMGS